MLSRGRPLCESLTNLLESLSKIKPKTMKEKAYLLNSYILAFKATGRKSLLEQINTLTREMISLQLDSGAWSSGSGADSETTASIVHALRTIPDEVESEEIHEVLKTAFNYALSGEALDIETAKILYEGYRYREDERYLDRMVELISKIDVSKRVEVFLLLLMATDRMEYLEKALKVIKPYNGLSKQETVYLLLWELSGFDPSRYPKQPNSRRYIAEHTSTEDPKGIWRALSYVVGEARIMDEEREKVVETPKVVDTPIRVLRDGLGECVILGRSKETQKELGCRGTLYIGCVGERRSEDKHLLGCKVLLDGVKPHVVFISGHRGSGKSYTMGVIAEELAESRLGIATILVDPMGIFWSMKYPNWEERELKTLEKWNLKPKGFSNVKVFIPVGFYDKVPEQTRDAPFSIRPSELTADDWCHTFSIDRFSTLGLLTEQVIEKVRNGYKAMIDDQESSIPGKGNAYTIDDLIRCIETASDIVSEDRGFRRDTRRALVARFFSAKQWGIFSAKGTSLRELAVPNQISVIDVSHLDDSLRALVIGILARRILRVRARLSRMAEAAQLGEATDEEIKEEIPVTWLMIDEAHLLAPSKGVTAASDPLIEYAKLGRKPGCGLVLVTQQPSATDSRILSQLDILITHFLSYEPDIVAFIKRSPAEVPEEIRDSGFLRNIPIGTTVVSDESITSSRALVVKIRPRLSQHSGREALPKMVEELAATPPEATPVPAEADTETVSGTEVEVDTEAMELEASVGGGEEMVEVAPDTLIPPPPVLDLPTDLASDYLERVLRYRFYNHLYPMSRMEGVDDRILTQADGREVIREVYSKLVKESWQTDTKNAGDVPVILGSKEKSRLALGVLETGDNTIVAISSTSALKNEAAGVVASLKELIGTLKAASRKRPKTKPETKVARLEEELPELPTPPPRPSIAEQNVEPETSKPPEEPVTVKPEEAEPRVELEAKEAEAGKASSREAEQERIIREIQKFQKYLRSLHEYFQLGRMTEDEYIFLKRKTFEKIEQLRRSLIE